MLSKVQIAEFRENKENYIICSKKQFLDHAEALRIAVEALKRTQEKVIAKDDLTDFEKLVDINRLAYLAVKAIESLVGTVEGE